MLHKKTKPKAGIKPFTKAFWELSRVRQEAFLKNLYDLSSQNKALFAARLGQDNTKVFDDLKKEIHKETFSRAGKFKKIRLSKLNEILRNAEKYALPMHQQIDLKAEVWLGMMVFINARNCLPERYQIATGRHLDQYFKMVQDHILEKSEVEERMAKDQQRLLGFFSKNCYLPHLKVVYAKWFELV